MHALPQTAHCCCVQGPTLTMRIHEYALMKDVTATLARPRQPDSMWKAPPLVVMNNFAGRPELKLATALFQNIFPAINVQTAKLSTCQAGLHRSRHCTDLFDCQAAHCFRAHTSLHAH